MAAPRQDQASQANSESASISNPSDERDSRRRILDAAASVFARRGYEGASIGEIAAESGFSKGALYWNFASKEELFYALLEELDDRLRPLISLSTTAPAEMDVTAELSRGLATILEGARDVVMLFHEYSALAVRDPAVRARYAKRNAQMRSDLACSLAAHYTASGIPPTVSPEHIATVVIALVHGLSIQQLTEPDVVPNDLFGEILCLIDDGLAAQAKEQT